jgi:hypothetical protein
MGAALTSDDALVLARPRLRKPCLIRSRSVPIEVTPACVETWAVLVAAAHASNRNARSQQVEVRACRRLWTSVAAMVAVAFAASVIQLSTAPLTAGRT